MRRLCRSWYMDFLKGWRSRKPHLTPFYQCVQDHDETLENVYQERFAKRYGFWRPYLREIMVHYLECGDLHAGFARIRCDSRGTEQAMVVYCSKDGNEKKTYDATEWLAAMACHVPERRKQKIRYYGAYANSVRGRQRKRQEAEPIPTVQEPLISSGAFRRNWARLIQKVYEVSPLVCKGDGPPGSITLWRGWKRLADLTEGWDLATHSDTCG